MIRRTVQRRRGIALLYLIVVMTTLFAFCSLAVDLGRVQLAKTELRCTADAAARAAISTISSGATIAANNAVAVAAANSADGSPVSLNATTEVEFGTWDPAGKTFTVLSGMARNNANAVRVTASRTAAKGNAVPLLFAVLLGRTTCDVRPTPAIAFMNMGTPNAGLCGLNSININGNAYTDSYDATKGAYSQGSARKNGSVVSNGSISLNGNANINGDAHPGSTGGQKVTMNGNAYVTGSTSPLTSALNYPAPTLPSSYTSMGNLNLSGNKSITLSSGNYYFTNFSISGNATINITGQVTIYVNGNLNLSGNANVHQNLPGNFKIRMLSSASVNISGNGALYADIYAPLSPISISGNGDIYGALIGASLNINGNGGLHYDESLNYTGGTTGGNIALVQ